MPSYMRFECGFSALRPVVELEAPSTPLLSAAIFFRLTWSIRANTSPVGMMHRNVTSSSSAPQAVAASTGAP